MPLAIQLFPDLDGLDGLVSDSETMLMIYLCTAAGALCLAAIVNCAAAIRRRSPVERLMKRRFYK